MKTSSARLEGDVERELRDGRPRRRHGKKYGCQAASRTGRVVSFGRVVLMLASLGLFFAAAGWAQEVKVVTEGAVAAPATATPQPQPGNPADAAKAAKAAEAAAKKAAGAAAAGKKDGQPTGDAAKPGEQKSAEPAVTQRPTKPPKEPSPDELKVAPDAEGRVRFSFNGQPWPAVLEWLATISNMSLDWQELPGDFLNLTTQQAYTIEETRGLINRHLLARGFTMLQHGEVLSIVNIKKLDPGLVPRVMPQDLEKRHPYEFVKVSFPLQWMMADTAAEELKPMISPNGKLNALKSTNRLEAIDAVINLRELYKLIKEEQSANGQERLVREFVLQHARAIDVQTQLNDLLGIEEKKGKGPMTPEQMQMQQQQAMMRAQQQQQQGQQPQQKKDEPRINLVINARKNSIVANAPPDKMAIVEQAVKVLDVPRDGAEELLANVNRMQVYRLAAVDPDALVETLNDLGVLHPTTRLQVDKKNKSIIVHAPMMDHLTIRALVGKLDGSGRKFEVIQLRRLEADYVAGSIDFMMGGAEKEKSQQRRPFYYDFGYYGNRQQEETSNDKFRVDADVENNRLLLWANPIELEEVMNLLAKLGEVPARGANTNTVRVLQLEPGKATDDALDRIRRAWPSLSPNPLVVPPSDQSSEAEPRRDRTKATEAPARAPSIKSIDTRSRETRSVPKTQSPTAEQGETVAVVAAPAVLRRMKEDRIADAQTAEQGGAAEAAPAPANKEVEKAIEIITRDAEVPPPAADIAEPAAPAAKTADQNGALDADRQRLRQQVEDALKADGRGRSGGNVPIVVNRGPNGELIVSSPDTEALDLFEEMVNEMGPARKDYKVFYLKHGFAFWVATRLEDYFEVEDSSKKNNNRGYPYYFFDDFGSSQNKGETRRLSRRRPLKFITDTDTNTILVTGADPNQLKIIEQLIEIYDRPEPMDSRAARMTKTFQLKYSKAKVVGDTVKDVYRDLLSSNDKALQQQQGDQKNKRPESQNTYITNFGGGEEEGKPTEVRFKGKLSIGTDELSNTLVVSTEGENLMNNVERLIESLDNAARPSLSTVRVLQTRGSMDSKDVRKALARALIDQQRAQQQQQQRPGQQQPGQNPQQQQQQFQQQPVDENGNVIQQ